jgi:hypothetical protein
MRHEVVRLELRGMGGEDAGAAVQELLTGGGHTNLSRLLVIDDAAALKRHREAYEALLPSPYVEQVMCVAIGRSGDDSQPLDVPGAITQAAAVLWVTDTDGIDWRLTGAAPVLHPGKGEVRDGGLLKLLEALDLNDVFEKTFELVLKIPGRVACPGLRLSGADDGRSDFLNALAAAAEDLLEPGGGRLPGLSPSAGERPAFPAVRLRKGCPLGDATEGAADALTDAHEMAEELAEAASLLVRPLPVSETARAAGDALALLRERVERLFTEAHSPAGLDSAQYEAIDRAGVDLPEPQRFDPATAGKAISDYLDEALTGSHPLPKILEGLDRRQQALLPHGSRERLPALRAACPDELIDGLRAPEPLPGPQPWLPAIGLVTAALAGLTPFGPASGLVMAALWALLIILTVVRGPGGRIADHKRSIAANGVAAAAGGLATGLAVPAPPSALWGLATLLALSGAALAVLRSWRSRADQWLNDSGLIEAQRTVDDVHAVIAAVAGEWSAADARIAEADAVARMSAALSQVAAEIGAHAHRLRGDFPGPVRMDQRVRHQLADLVRAAMEPRLRELHENSAGHHGEAARAKTAELFQIWDECVTAHGPFERPPFATARTTDDAVPFEEPAELVRAAGYDAHDVMRQLCAVTDLPLLELGGPDLAVVRFVPQHGRTTGDDLMPADTLRVPSARHAGVLRMVPVRPGVVAPSW